MTLGGSGGGDDLGAYFGDNGNGHANHNNNNQPPHRPHQDQGHHQPGTTWWDPDDDDDDGDDSSSSDSSGDGHGQGHDDGGAGGCDVGRRSRRPRSIKTSSLSRYKEADKVQFQPCPNASGARNLKMAVRDVVVVVSGRGETAWACINEVTKPGRSFGGFYNSGEFASLDDTLGIAISETVSGDVKQDIFNRTGEMAKVSLMIKGRQKQNPCSRSLRVRPRPRPHAQHPLYPKPQVRWRWETCSISLHV